MAKPKRGQAGGGPRRPKCGKGPVRASRGRGAALHVRWGGFRPMFDFWGNELERYYKLDTLANATERLLQTKDQFVVPSVQQVLGPAPVVSFAFELFQEGRHQIIFRLGAANAKRKRAQFAFVVGKRSRRESKVAETEHANLRVLHQRAPEHVVRPFRGGLIYLPDRHGRSTHGREVYAYLTQWLSGYHELGVGRNLQFIINESPRHTFTIAQTEHIKGRIVEILARTYDPAKRRCIEIPEVASGDFVVTRPAGRGNPGIKLVACRRLVRNVTPAKLIRRLVDASWDWGGREFRLAPAEPETLFDGLAGALGADEARGWLRQYVAAVSDGLFPEQEALPVEALAGLV